MIRGWRVGTRRMGGVSLINIGVRGEGTTSSASSAWVMTQGAGREGLPEAQGPQARHDSSLCSPSVSRTVSPARSAPY